MNPRSRDEPEKSIFVFSKNNCSKDNIKTAHWVGHSQLISLYTYDLCKRTPVVDGIHDSVTGNTMKQSAHEKENNPYLL